MKLRATTKIRNEKIISFREARGWNQAKLAKACGISLRDLFKFEKLDFNMRNAEEKAIKIAVITEISVDDILPEDLVGKTINTDLKVTKDVEVQALLSAKSTNQNRLIEASPDEMLSLQEGREALQSVLETLTFRERKILELKYGLNGNQSYSDLEIAKIFKLSHSRIGQIIQKGIRKLQHPKRLKTLAKYTGEYP